MSLIHVKPRSQIDNPGSTTTLDYWGCKITKNHAAVDNLNKPIKAMLSCFGKLETARKELRQLAQYIAVACRNTFDG